MLMAATSAFCLSFQVPHKFQHLVGFYLSTDDIALYSSIQQWWTTINFQNDINVNPIFSGMYIFHNHSQCNTAKCKLMLISRKRTNSLPSPSLYLNGTVLARVSSCKCLGVTLTSNLLWWTHITNYCNKAQTYLTLVKVLLSIHKSPGLLRVYKSFVRPHLEYVCIAWSSHHKGEIEVIEHV